MRITNILSKITRYRQDIRIKEVEEIIKNNSNAILLDVRSPQEYKEGHLNRALNIPLYELEMKAERYLLNKADIIIVYCSAGIRSKKAVKILNKKGYKNLYNIENGINNI